jgi:hypothetical protein
MDMDIRDIALGDTVKLKNGKESIVLAIFNQDSSYAIAIEDRDGWRLDENAVVTLMQSRCYSLMPNWKDFEGKRFFWTYGGDRVVCVVKGSAIHSSVPVVKQSGKVPERPCPQCNRKNDIGVSECWYCLRPNP